MKEFDILTEKDAQRISEMLYKQHNAITSGRFDFTACQLDILFMILSSLKADEMEYRIYAKDIEFLTGRQWNYQQLRDATQDMGSRMFEIDLLKDDGKKIYRQLWLFQKVDYVEGQGCFDVMISEPAKPYFFELKNNFTQFQLKSVLGCSSSYAKRLYMLACQWRAVGKFPRPIPIIELKKMLGLVDKKGNEQYYKISQFKEKVLDIAKKQINEHTDIHFEYELFKKGRSFEFIQIYVDSSKNNPKQLAIDFKNDINFQKEVRNIMAYGLNEDQATAIAKDGYAKFVKFVEDVIAKSLKKEINVNNTAGYIIGAYQKKGVIPKNN